MVRKWSHDELADAETDQKRRQDRLRLVGNSDVECRAARLISIRRRDSGSPLQASAIPPLVRTDEIRFFRPTGDISRNPCVAAPSTVVATIASTLPASHGAQSIPAAR